MRTRLYLLFAMVLLVSACSEEAGDPVSATDPSNGETATFAKSDRAMDLTDRYIVVFKEGVGNPDVIVDEVTRGNGTKVHYRYRHALKGFAATIPEAALEGISRNPLVDYIEPDGVVTAGTTQTSPPSWGLDHIDQHNLPRDYSYTYQTDGTGVTVYIIDSGIRWDHAEYFGRAVIGGKDFIDNDDWAYDCHGHGTHVAGTVGGTTVGVAKGVSLYPIRVLACNGSGSYSAVIAGIDWVTANHTSPAVANMSLGGGYSTSLNTAVNNSVAAGVVYAVSAGNDNTNACTKSPASAASALTVGSSTSSDYRSSFSNYGSCVDIFAPGSSIYSSTMTSTTSYASWSGTSMASPHVAGVAALYLEANQTATPAQVEAAIKNGATSGVLNNIGTGSPNLLLYSQITGPVTPPSPPAAPTGLTQTAATTSSVTLGWNDVSGESGYRVERDISGTWTQVGSTGADVTSFTESGLSAGTSYDYRVYAYNSGGNSGYSNTETATTSTPPPPPSTIDMDVLSVVGDKYYVRKKVHG
ncbi:MAG: peptidase S8, partial [Ignavibacteria bacterium]